MSTFAQVDRWLDEVQVSAKERTVVKNILGNGFQEGWEPNQQDTLDLADFVAGRITAEQENKINPIGPKRAHHMKRLSRQWWNLL